MLELRRLAGFLIAASMMLPAASGAAMLECPAVAATVRHEDGQSARIACEAAADAVGLMAAHGFAVEAPIEIEVVGELAGGAGPHVVGQFSAADGRVRIRTLADAARSPGEQTGFGVPMTPELYRSFIAHEVAHAVAQRNFTGPRPSLEAHEYIACVVQFATMAPDLRDRLLAAIDTRAFARDEEISGTLYLIAPGVFAAKAWLHFLSPGNGDAFLQRLREGRFRPPTAR